MPKVSYSKLYEDIKEQDRSLAPGSETTAWGQFLNRMQECGIEDVHCSNKDDEKINADESSWWLEAYSRLSDGQDWDDIFMLMN